MRQTGPLTNRNTCAQVNGGCWDNNRRRDTGKSTSRNLGFPSTPPDHGFPLPLILRGSLRRTKETTPFFAGLGKPLTKPSGRFRRRKTGEERATQYRGTISSVVSAAKSLANSVTSGARCFGRRKKNRPEDQLSEDVCCVLLVVVFLFFCLLGWSLFVVVFSFVCVFWFNWFWRFLKPKTKLRAGFLPRTTLK